MRVARIALFLAVIFQTSSQLHAQQASVAPQRDPQAVAILTQAITVAGGSAVVAAVQDFSSSGTITYFRGDEEIQGSVTVRSKGLSQFRLDATLPTGVRSWVVSNGSGSTKDADGTTTSIPYHNAVDLGSLTFPLAYIPTALKDSATKIRYLGLVVVHGHQAHQIRVEPFATENDPGNMLSKLNAKDFFIDPTTFQISSVLDTMHPDGDSTIDFPHETEFSDYRIVSGLLVPFSITETIGSNRIWTIELARVALNSGLSDGTFQL